MKRQYFLMFSTLLCFSALCNSQIHQTVSTAGGNASGAGGSSISYTIGQITYSLKTASEWTVQEGVQQPYEISELKVDIHSSEEIALEYKVYPNPAHEYFRLTITPCPEVPVRFRLFNNNGILLLDKEVISEVTEISLEDFLSTVYFLRIYINDKEVKIFKIVKI